MTATDVKRSLKKLVTPGKAQVLQRFFKTGKGEYAEGDIFIGVMVPNIRKVVKQYSNLPLTEVVKLLHSKIHEERLTASFILVAQYKKGDEKLKQKIFNLYLANTKYIINWDLVDLTAHHIVGEQLRNGSKQTLYKLATSKDLWEKRISIISTFAYIKAGESKETLKIAKMLLNDDHDLIHKAAGWMLREVGKRASHQDELNFLQEYAKKMPRTMLRYAIERFPEGLRKKIFNTK
jgi:3-methyladenine DNA glycosylase AlkD